MNTASTTHMPTWQDWLTEPRFRRALAQSIRTRVRSADVEDVLQTTLAEVVAAHRIPSDPTEFRRWVYGIARRVIADHHADVRRHARSLEREEETGDDAVASLVAQDMLRWVQQQLPSGSSAQKTLETMLKEADGDSLETQAADEQIPAPRLRQRVVRLRDFLRKRWAAELALASALVVLMVGGYWWATHRSPGMEVAPDATVGVQSDAEKARELRQQAAQQCDQKNWRPCLALLDKARSLDPEGDKSDQVGVMRSNLKQWLERQDNSVPAPSAPSPVRPLGSPGSTGKAMPACTCPPQDPACGCLPGLSRCPCPDGGEGCRCY